MKISGHRKGISPIVATVLIIAATLIAFAAVLGYIFGIFGGAANTANVSVTSVDIAGSGLTGTAAATCAQASGTGSYIQLTDTGSANTQVSSLSITYGGSTYSATLTGCGSSLTLNAGSSIYLQITALTGLGAGQTFNGEVGLANGELATFTGTSS